MFFTRRGRKVEEAETQAPEEEKNHNERAEIQDEIEKMSSEHAIPEQEVADKLKDILHFYEKSMDSK